MTSARPSYTVYEHPISGLVISRMGTGVDKIDVAAAMAQGILVTNVPHFCVEEQHVIYEHDYAFHRTLWEIAGHSILIEVVSGLRARLSRFLYEAASALSQQHANRVY